MTVKELRKALKNARYQDATIQFFIGDDSDAYEIKSISESHIIAEVDIELKRL